jgi:DNA-binding response OmpR family regulator
MEDYTEMEEIKDHILIIDNDIDTLDSITEFFKDYPFADITTCADFGNCFVLFESTIFSMAVVNLKTVGDSGNGFDFISKIRKLDPYISIIIVTDKEDTILDCRVVQLGVDDIIQKPFKMVYFGYKLLLNLSRNKRYKIFYADIDLMKKKYNKNIEVVKTSIEKLEGLFNKQIEGLQMCGELKDGTEI